MTMQQMLASCWGKPDHKNVTIVGDKQYEQWVYKGGAGYLYFNNNGVLDSIQMLEQH